jgi:hypothetical protein
MVGPEPGAAHMRSTVGSAVCRTCSERIFCRQRSIVDRTQTWFSPPAEVLEPALGACDFRGQLGYSGGDQNNRCCTIGGTGAGYPMTLAAITRPS